MKNKIFVLNFNSVKIIARPWTRPALTLPGTNFQAIYGKHLFAISNRKWKKNFQFMFMRIFFSRWHFQACFQLRRILKENKNIKRGDCVEPEFILEGHSYPIQCRMKNFASDAQVSNRFSVIAVTWRFQWSSSSYRFVLSSLMMFMLGNLSAIQTNERSAAQLRMISL